MSEIYRKRQILQQVNDNPGSTSRDIAKALRISAEDAQMFLFRLFRATLVSRETSPTLGARKPSFAYEVTVRGSERLAYWQTQEGKKPKRRRTKRGVSE